MGCFLFSSFFLSFPYWWVPDLYGMLWSGVLGREGQTET